MRSVDAAAVLAAVGERTRSVSSEASRIAAVALAATRVSLDVRSWSYPVRSVFVRQLYFSGVQALRLIVLLSCLCGVAVVLQVQIWMANIGQSDLTGTVLVRLLISGIAPVFVGFVIIGRSGTAICAELAGMRNRHELHVLEAQGVDTFTYLVMPRSAAISISHFCLSMIFVAVSLFSGWIAGVLTGAMEVTLQQFADSVLFALAPAAIFDFAVKCLFGGLVIGAISCVEGLSTSGLSTEIPQAVTKGVVLSIATMLVVSFLVSVIFYV